MIDAVAFIKEAVRFVTKVGGINARVIMSDLYDTKYQIYDHLKGYRNADGQNRFQAPPRPLATVAFFPAEDFDNGGLMETIMRQYVEKDVWEVFHISLDEFMDRPRDVIDMMLGICEDIERTKAEALTNIEGKLGKK